ncbi:MAG: hypothetical protein ABIO88_04065 [Burkholderiaceae bacterium]
MVTSVLALSACGAGDASTDMSATTDSSATVVGADSSTRKNGSGRTGSTSGSTTTTTPTTTTTTTTPTTTTTTTTPTTTTPTTTTTTGTVSTSVYTITVYYTAVESFHTDAKINVSGCLIRDCAFGNNLIGNYPASFINATKTEGTGRITSGVNAGKYLNWSVDVGYWLDTIPSDGYGTALVPFRTAAADDIALARGTLFKLLAPLIQDDGTALDSISANKLLAAQWLINDQFTPGLGGALHLDLYIGEEDRLNFTNTSPLYTTLMNTQIARL